MHRTMDFSLCVDDRSLIKFHGRDGVEWKLSMSPIKCIFLPGDHIDVTDKI